MVRAQVARDGGGAHDNVTAAATVDVEEGRRTAAATSLI